jgi:aminoglycoside/choline kinase family phosphotransferase
LPEYDEALLRRELELFPHWYLQQHLGLAIDADLQASLDSLFQHLIDHALSQAKVFVHRDFMPRNLMVSEPNPGVLDFQDAVRGPISYDPICLFKDAFISWPEKKVEQWLGRYWQQALDSGLPVPSSFEQFQYDCDLMGLHRHLKVIGIFARICHRDGKPRYLEDAPRFFNYIATVAARRPDIPGLAAVLNYCQSGAVL